MNLSLFNRYSFLVLCVLVTLGTLPFLTTVGWLWSITLLTGGLSLLGV